MPKICSFMICDSSQSITDEKNNTTQQLVGPTIALRPQFIPTNYSFTVSIGIRDVDLQAKNVMHLALLTPSGKELVNLGESELPITDKDNLLPRENWGFVAGVDFHNVSIAEEGVYRLAVYVNNELIGTLDIPIYRGRDDK